MASDEENWIPVPENPDSNIVITIPVTEERTGNGSSWAEIVEAERPGVSHNDPARAVIHLICDQWSTRSMEPCRQKD